MGNGIDNICKSMRLHPSPSPRFAASAPRSRVLARLASLAQIGELAHRLSLFTIKSNSISFLTLILILCTI